MKAFETILIELAIIVFIIGWTESDSQKFESVYVQWASDCDSYGFGIAHASVNSHQCAGKCLANRRCASFTWYGNTCYLKTEIMDSVHLPLLPFKFLSGAVCGYISAQVGFQSKNGSQVSQKAMLAGDTYNGAQSRNDTWPDILGF